MLFTSMVCAAFAFALLKAGKSIPAKMAMIAMTTSSSMSVTCGQFSYCFAQAALWRNAWHFFNLRGGTLQRKVYSPRPAPPLGQSFVEP